MSKESDNRRCNKPEIVTDMAEIDAMPMLMGLRHLSRITGNTEIYLAKQCRDGMFSGIAVKCGREWRVNKMKALELLGLA